MKIDGACHCGSITYEATIDPETVGICHCTDCQTLSGSVFRTFVLARREHFRLLTGELTIYVKTGDSGAQRAQAFCPACGTPIYSAANVDPQVFSIRAGTARQRNDLIPKQQIWSRSAQRWLRNLESIEDFAGQPPLRL